VRTESHPIYRRARGWNGKSEGTMGEEKVFFPPFRGRKLPFRMTQTTALRGNSEFKNNHFRRIVYISLITPTRVGRMRTEVNLVSGESPNISFAEEIDFLLWSGRSGAFKKRSSGKTILKNFLNRALQLLNYNELGLTLS